MKSYAIYDADLDRKSPIGYLFYYEKSQNFIIELNDDLDEWEAPLLFQKQVREKNYTVSREYSLMWVKERVIPSGRQNIGSILKNHKLKEYSEMALLEISKGKCSQDACYIQEIESDNIPIDIKERTLKNVWECFPTQDNQIVCMYRDGLVQKVDLSALLNKYKDIEYVIKNELLLDSLKVGVGGYSIVFNDSIEIQRCDLRDVGQGLPLYTTDFLKFMRRNLKDTTKTCDMMQCSRQNLSYLVKMEKIKPVICGTKENMYLKGEIEILMEE